MWTVPSQRRARPNVGVSGIFLPDVVAGRYTLPMAVTTIKITDATDDSGNAVDVAVSADPTFPRLDDGSFDIKAFTPSQEMAVRLAKEVSAAPVPPGGPSISVAIG